MKPRLFAVSAALAVATFCSGPVFADIIFDIGNNPQPGEENINFNGSGTESGPALTVSGLTDQSDLLVTFTGTENLVTPAQGQARIEAEDQVGFQNLSIALTGGTFGDFILNPIIAGQGNSVQGLVHFIVHQAGGLPDATFDLNASSAGNNFLTIVATNGQRITGIDLSTSLTISSLQQNRISTPVECPRGSTDPLCTGPVPSVPEPGVLALLGMGVTALALARRRKPS